MRYEPRLDGLRCIAIMFVLVEHFVFFIGTKISAGFYGVNLFFVLSGFLITSILIRLKADTFKNSYLKFLGRRMLRIFPVYYLVIFLLWIVKVPGIQHDVGYLLTYTYNYKLAISQNWGTVYSAYWILCVEEQFYIFFPILVLLLRKRIYLLMLVCITFIVCGYLQIISNLFGLEVYNYVGLFTNMIPLCMGAVGAILIQKQKISINLFKGKYIELILFTLLILALTCGSPLIVSVFSPILNVLIVVKAASFPFSFKFIDNFLTHRIPIFVGKISYGIYVYHLIVSYYFVEFIFNPLWNKLPFPPHGFWSKLYYNDWLLRAPMLIVLTIGVAWVSFKYFESPLLSLKDKLFQYK